MTTYTLCGSSRFPEAFHLVNAHLSLRGHIVISLGLFGHADEPRGARFLTSDGDENTDEKIALDQLHFRKIDLSDAVFVINVGGYVGSSTKREIAYAQSKGKAVEWLFPEHPAEQPDRLRAAVERLTKDNANLQARLTARAKSMLKLRDALSEVHDNIEDEGDRVYFGSTNDADTFKDVWQELDAWHWNEIMEDGKLKDVYEVSRKAHAKATAAEARVKALEEGLEPFARPTIPPCHDDDSVLDCVFSVGAIRRARALLDKPGGE